MTDPFNPNSFGNPNRSQSEQNSKLFVSPEHSRTSHVDSSRPDSSGKPKSSRPVISARRELRLKHSAIRRNVLIGIAILIGLILALIATDMIKLGTGPRPSFSQTSQSLTVPTQSAIVAGEQLEFIRELNGKDPLRIYIGGDSLVGSFGRELATDFGKSGVIKATYDSRPSSGLVNTDFFDWNKHIKTIKQNYKPEIIFFMIGTNDASVVGANPSGYEKAYTDRLDSFLEIAAKDDTRVIFVLAPAMKESALDKNLKKLNQVIIDFSKNNNVKVVDSNEVLTPTKKYSSSVRYDNKLVTVRADDGVHINGKGGELIASQLKNFLFSNFKVSQYSSEIEIKPVKVPGCCKSPTNVPSGTGKQQVASTTTAPPSGSTSTSTSTSTTTSDTQPELETNE